MTKEQKEKALAFLKDMQECTYDGLGEIRTAIEALEQEPSEDCVSREGARQFLYEEIDRLNNDELYDIFSKIIDDMYNELPPVTPTRKGGKWISNVYQNRSCSICNYFISEDDVSEFNYCPNCGSHMRSNENEKNTNVVY